jgi:hypothetical protein
VSLTPGQICTIALHRVGEKQRVDNLDANTTSAKLCNAIYAMARDACLEEFAWPFATRRAVLDVLADDEDDDEARTGWAYTYALPTDCLAPLYIESGLQHPAPDQQVPFRVEDDEEEGPVLLTDMEEAELVYTRVTTETGKFTPLFADALAWRIAYELALCLPVKPQVGERMMAMYRAKVNEAAAATLRHSKDTPVPKPASVRARY